MSDIRIAVILPSRGLLFSQTADELLQNLQGYDYDVFFAHKLPIPDCFEKPLKRALRSPQRYTHFLFIEDDMILSDDILDAMLIADLPAVTCDYPVSKDGQGAVFSDIEGRVVFSGTGCLLVKRFVFDRIKKPYFRTDIRWGATNYGDFIRLTANHITNPHLEGYGLHDTNFGIKLWHAGIPISVIGTIGQRKLVKLGKAGSNNGAHEIEEWTEVKPDVLLKKFQSMPAMPTGVLVTVNTLQGELMVHPDKAKKMIKAGTATKIPRQSVSFDLNGLQL